MTGLFASAWRRSLDVAARAADASGVRYSVSTGSCTSKNFAMVAAEARGVVEEPRRCLRARAPAVDSAIGTLQLARVLGLGQRLR